MGRGQLTTHHGRNQSVVAQLCRRVLAHQLAITQHRDAVAQRIHLVQKVGDKQNRHALVAQLAQHPIKTLHFLVVQARCGFVQYQHLGRDAQAAGDGHHLLHRHRVAGQRLGDVNVQVQPGQQRAGFAVHAGPIDSPQTCRTLARVATGKNILGHRQVGAEVDLLVHRTDAQALRVQGGGGTDGLAIQAHFTLVGRVDAGQNLDKGGLARAVLAHEGMHFARKQAQVHAREGPHGTELLGHAGKLQHGRSGIAGRWCVCHGVV